MAHCIMKTDKRTGKRQTWELYKMREGVSATVWDKHPASVECATARECLEHAHGLGLPAPSWWSRRTGRGSANYYTSA